MSAAGDRFTVAAADHAIDAAALHAVREEVFVQGQGVPAALERDGRDASCRHVLARDVDGAAIGTGRLAPDGKLGRMAVLPAWRDRGVGAAMLAALVAQARDAGLAAVTLHAQVEALAFYRRHGFVEIGERFVEAGIAHQAMRRLLAGPQPVVDREGAVAATVAIVAGARRRLWIHTRELDPGLYDDPQVLDALRAFATRGGGVEVQLMLHDAAAPQRAHAPLLSLAQRLPSVFAFREVDDPVDRAYVAAFIASDGGGYYHRGLGHRYDGETETAAPARARQLADAFRPVWERSRPVGEFRALGL